MSDSMRGHGGERYTPEELAELPQGVPQEDSIEKLIEDVRGAGVTVEVGYSVIIFGWADRIAALWAKERAELDRLKAVMNGSAGRLDDYAAAINIVAARLRSEAETK